MKALAIVAVLLAAGCSHSAKGPASGFGGSPPPASVVKGWAAKWCQASPGISKQALYKIMGEPTGKQAESDEWRGYQYLFIAFYNADDTVRSLLNNNGNSDVQCAQDRSQSP